MRINMKNTIFIAGVHGIGKTYYCSRLSKMYKNVKHLTASSLIKMDSNNMSSKEKRVKSIDSNQQIMINNYSLLRQRDEDLFLFDGHFVLIDSTSKIVEIKVEVFKSLDLSAIILFIDDVQSIHNRLIHRDIESDLTIDILDEIQKNELTQAKRISQNLKIPLTIVNLKNENDNKTMKDLSKILNNYIK